MSFGRKTINDKILLLGVDGLDPRLTQKYVAEGKLPNLAEYIRRGASAKDLVLLGGHPTVTPPMWTTLATGCYANVHGITGSVSYTHLSSQRITLHDTLAAWLIFVTTDR